MACSRNSMEMPHPSLNGTQYHELRKECPCCFFDNVNKVCHLGILVSVMLISKTICFTWCSHPGEKARKNEYRNSHITEYVCFYIIIISIIFLEQSAKGRMREVMIVTSDYIPHPPIV